MTAKAAKTVKYGASVEGISTAEPDQYAKRFLAFMGDAIEWSRDQKLLLKFSFSVFSCPWREVRLRES